VTQPILWILAGPNGAGKSTLYEFWVKPRTDAEFVNADLLATAHFGHPASTEAESLWGQQAAEARRQALLQAGANLVVESTFSHPSKLDLIANARAANYAVHVLHLSVDDVGILIARVSNRVRKGGHPVPEERIRRRFVRNQPIIREAVRQSHKGWIFDSSVRNAPPRICATFTNGTGTAELDPLPAWVDALYGADLA
jgi:predicted ABC-type ATPase